MVDLLILSTAVPRAQHSTAPHNHPCTTQQTMYVPIRAHIKTYMHAASGLFSWIMELLAFASRLFAPQGPSTTYICHSVPFFLVGERSGRNRALATRSALYIISYWCYSFASAQIVRFCLNPCTAVDVDIMLIPGRWRRLPSR